MAAPGEDMVAACGSESGLCRTHGTSDATALASASAALIWSKHPTWTNNQVLRVMLNTIGAPTDGKKRNDAIGYGIVRPRIALQNPGDPGKADVYPLPDLKAAASRSPSSGTTVNEGSNDTGAPAEQKTSVSASKDNSGVLWIALGSGGVVLTGGAIALVMRRRRKPAGVPLPPVTSGQFSYPETGFTSPPGAPGGGYPPGQGPGAG